MGTPGLQGAADFGAEAMQVFKTSEPKFGVINDQLKEGKTLTSAGEKLVKSAKASVVSWLKSERHWDVEAQPVGAIAIIQLDGKDCIKIERRGRRAVDVTRLQSERPEVAEEFSQEKAATYIDAL